jgi:hypothetical protein
MYALRNMGMLKRLNDPIDPPMRSHDDWHEECTRKGSCAQGWGAPVQEMNG